MTFPDSQPLLMPILVAAALLGFLALLLIRRGWRPTRVGTTPHCARCDYIVGSIETARCPECGSALDAVGAIVQGERPVRRGMGALGALLGLLSVALVALVLTPAFQRVEWYRYVPLNWVLDDYESQLNATSTRGWNELERRLNAGTLSIGDQRRIIEAFLSRLEGDSSVIATRAGTVVAGRWVNFTSAQKDRFFAAALTALQSNVVPVRNAAEGELDRMMDGKELSALQRSQVYELGLAHQKDGGSMAGRWLMKHLERAELAGNLTPQQQARFRQQCQDVTDFQVRRKVILGDPVSYRYVINGRGPESAVGNGQPSWWSAYKIKQVRLDGEVVSQGRMSGSGSFGRSSGSSSIQCKTAGRHKLEVDMELLVYWGKREGSAETIQPRWTKELTLSREFEVLATAPADFIGWIGEPSATVMKQLIVPERVDRSSRGNRGNKGLDLMVKFESLPVNVGFEVIGRVDGKEHPIAHLAVSAGAPTTYGFGTDEFPPTPSGTIDLIFRSHERTVRRTPNMYQAWRGELVYENVPVSGK